MRKNWFVEAFVLAFMGIAIPAAGASAQSLIFWHNQTGIQARFVEKLLAEFNAGPGRSTPIRGETGLELESTLMSRIDPTIRPDLLLIPSDMMGFEKELQLAELPASWSRVGVDSAIPQDRHGIPLLRGNQVFLFYNKRLVSRIPATWKELQAQHVELKKKGIGTIGWPWAEPYYFLPFLQAFGKFNPDRLDEPSVGRALAFYRELGVSGLVPLECGLDCNTSRFLKGEFAFAISGDWAIAEAKARLGADFGLAPLPAVSESQPLIPGEEIQYLVFPNRKSFRRNETVLRQFSEFMLSFTVQRRWKQEVDRAPVHVNLQAPSTVLARRVPEKKSMVYSWTALRKGLELLKTGEKDIPLRMQKLQRELLRTEGDAKQRRRP